MRISPHKIKAEPKYVEIAGHIRGQIKSGSLSGGDRISTVAEYCSNFNVSATAVDRALFLLDQEGLITRRNGRGIYVAQLETVKGPTVACIGFKLDEVSTVPFVSHLLKGIQQAKQQHELDLMMSAYGGESIWGKVQGVFVHSDLVNDILAQKPAHIPATAIMITSPLAPSVCADDFEGARLAANHLIDLGHHKIVYIISPKSGQMRRRLAGFRSALSEAGKQFDAGSVCEVEYGDSPFIERGRSAMRRLLANGWIERGYTAIMGQNDLLAIGAMQVLQEAGFRVPDDVSIIGYDDTDECLLTTPTLTTVHVPLEAIGEAAVDLLIRQLNGRLVPCATLSFPVRLIVRGSSGPVRSIGPNTFRATSA